MQKGYIINEPVGNGLYIQVTNFKGLNQIGHYRYSDEAYCTPTYSAIGAWKPKLIKS
jgi:hypothetical protein